VVLVRGRIRWGKTGSPGLPMVCDDPRTSYLPYKDHTSCAKLARLLNFDRRPLVAVFRRRHDR
jgi:hypothetical protein